MIKKTLGALFIASSLLYAADPAGNTRVAKLFAQVARERCLFEYVDDNTKKSLFCVDKWNNYYTRTHGEAKIIAFSEGILQQYLTHKEATALMLVSKFHHQEIIKYREKRILLHLEETKEESKALRNMAFNDLGVRPQSVVFDASGNSGCGITNDVTKIVAFTAYPFYKKTREAWIDAMLSKQHIIIPAVTKNHTLGACMFHATETFNIHSGYGYGTRTSNFIVTYLPHLQYTLHNKVDPTLDIPLYLCLVDAVSITFAALIQCKYVTMFAKSSTQKDEQDNIALMKYYESKIATSLNLHTLQQLSREGDMWAPFFTVSLPSYKRKADEEVIKEALEQLHDFSPS